MSSQQEAYIYSAAQIEALTWGDVKTKTINNWITASLWVTPLEAFRSGYARRFSRANVIEAVIASRLRPFGVPRWRCTVMMRDQKRLFELQPYPWSWVLVDNRITVAFTPEQEKTVSIGSLPVDAAIVIRVWRIIDEIDEYLPPRGREVS